MGVLHNRAVLTNRANTLTEKKTPLDRTIKSAKMHAEKAHQIEPTSLEAFGIKLWTRHGKFDEMMEMLSFAHELDARAAAGYVLEVFYDSNATIAFLTVAP